VRPDPTPGGTTPTFTAGPSPSRWLSPMAALDTHTEEGEAPARAPIDTVVRTHDYARYSTTGWHRHPGPILITVTQGTITYYESDDPTCPVYRVDRPGVCGRRTGTRRAERDRPTRSRRERDHRAGGRPVPHRSRR
jgi:hypothetical protein